MQVYQAIEKEGNRGLWTRHMRSRTGLDTATYTKILKTLENKKLIKSEISIEGKNRKVYMLFDLIPAREISGSVFHSGHEFDMECINVVASKILDYLHRWVFS